MQTNESLMPSTQIERYNYDAIKQKCKQAGEHISTTAIVVYLNEKVFPSRAMNEAEFNRKFAEYWTLIVDAYFAATAGTSSIAMREARIIFLEKFGAISVNEILEAARQYASGDLNIDIKTFGQFTVKNFTDLISAYKKKRDIIQASLQDADKETALKAQEAERNKAKDAFVLYSRKWLSEQLANKTISSWSDVPYSIALHLSKMLPERNELREEAVKLHRKMLIDTPYDRGRRLMGKQLQAAIESPDPAAIETIYIRLLTYTYINNETSNI